MSRMSSLANNAPNLQNSVFEKMRLNGGLLTDQEAVDSFLLSLQSAGRSDATIRTYVEALDLLRRFSADNGMPPLLALSTEHLRAFLKSLYDKGNKPATVRNRWASIGAFYKWAADEGERPDNPMLRIKPPQVPERVLPHYSSDDVSRVLAPIPEKATDELNLRDRAIIITLFDTGLRATELCSLRREQLNLRERTITVRGKGGKERAVGIGATTASAIDRYLRRRRVHTPWLFSQRDGTHVSTNTLRMLLQRRYAAGGVAFRGAHAFRRGFGIEFLQAGGDPNDLKTLAGWSSYEMLRRYTRATETLRGIAAHRKFSPADRLNRR